MKTPTARALNVKRYGELLVEALPMVITTEAEYDRLRAAAECLMNRDENDLSAEEVKLLDLLVTLIDRYEETHYTIEPGTPHEILHHLMEARGLAHKDVWKLFGSKGIASEVLNGKRAISKTHARALADFFHVSADLFIGHESAPRRAS
jgi:HTH-type transcriptional regulator/antitoxin HigA